jgi:hypothetical protein
MAKVRVASGVPILVAHSAPPARTMSYCPEATQIKASRMAAEAEAQAFS